MQSTTSVSVRCCHDYDPPKVARAIRKALQESGNENAIKSGERVFVKINHLPPASPPERGIVTHPVLVEEAVKVLLDLGAKVTIGDDVEANANPYAVSGMAGISQRLGVNLVNLKERGFKKITLQDTELLKTVHIARDVLEADALVSLPKLKTHSYTILTGALKNMFGAIPQGERINFHRDYQTPEIFSRALVDLYTVLRPRLSIVDGIVAMEGEGPAAGKTKTLGAVLVGRDAVAVDAVIGLLINLRPHYIHTCRIADERELGIGDPQRIEILGEGMDPAVTDFLLPASSAGLVRTILPPFLYRWLYDQMVRVELEVNPEKCTACHMCLRVCPTGAMLPGGPAMKIDRDLCIECFCCQETCRCGAVIPREKKVAKMIKGVVNVLRRH